MKEDSLKKLRMFVASPSDVAAERSKLETVAEGLEPLADHLGVSIDVIDWRKAIPDMGRPQKVIFDQLKPTTWDIFIGILWHRFGTPSGARDLLTNKEYLSGTEEEFQIAHSLWKDFKRPRIMLYRCTREVNLDVLDVDQFKRVKEFFAQFEAVKGEHPGLYQSFGAVETFERLLLDNLQRLLISYSDQTKGQAISSEAVEALSMRARPDTVFLNSASFGQKSIPEMDFYTTPDTVIVELSLPGIEKQNLDIRLEESTIVVSGKVTTTRADCNYLCQERLHGRFSRSVELPVPVQGDKTKAQFDNGVLTIRLPRQKGGRD